MTDVARDKKRFGNLATILLNKKYWGVHFAAVVIICLSGLVYMGDATYDSAPPLGDFVTEDGTTVFSREQIMAGQEVFHLRGLMSYGSFWGDGAERGPDFTADALHYTYTGMVAHYVGATEDGTAPDPIAHDAAAARTRRELKTNTWDEAAGTVTLTEGQVAGFETVATHFSRMFTDPDYPELFQTGYLTDPTQLRDLSAYFFWGGWVAAAHRPGETYSYTHNWPYDPEVGNSPTPAVVFWSILSVLALFLGIGLVLYIYGQMKSLQYDPFTGSQDRSLTTYDLENGNVRKTQRATYKFFALAMLAFGLQVTVGILAASDFVRPGGIFLGDIIPFTVLRSYHTLLQIYWFFMCWVGYTIFFLPRLGPVPRGQGVLIELLFACCFIVGAGSVIGIYAGQTGILTGKAAYWFGSQGWEFLEMGRAFQILLLAAFSLWIVIIYRGIKPWLTLENLWSVPAWLLYGSSVMVFFLFFGLMVTPESNFAISDFWRWMVVHMWVEVTFEVFTTVIVAYMLVQMGLITRIMAERVIFLAVMLFLLTATVGIAHNFYWIAKPTGVIAFGSVFSTLQVLPLLLLTLDAWRMRQEKGRAAQFHKDGQQSFVMNEVWLFVLAVNFWNVFGAGVFGSMINLPIINYFEHSTYLTGNHAHAAMFGVKGNIALGGMLFCCQHLFKDKAWNRKLIRISFWSMNIGLAMMMFLDLLPAGLYQFWVVLEEGFWYARSQEVIQGEVFRTLTMMRSWGGLVFTLGGVIPLVWFILSRATRIRKTTKEGDGEWSPNNDGWANTSDAPTVSAE
ncbi:cbb3-type cytochrome c oxidase subunit I [Rhodobacteraceae bacterium LMO-12]|nr:cbb3-type cytochrome c oxidase subunit I [Rhodobacteraceae bacterium LMO-JJ12]